MQGRGRQQTEKISTGRQGQKGRQQPGLGLPVQVNTGNQKTGETLRMLARGKQDFAMGECMCAAYM